MVQVVYNKDLRGSVIDPFNPGHDVNEAGRFRGGVWDVGGDLWRNVGEKGHVFFISFSD